MFCRALKGSVFRDCMKPIIDFIKRDDQPLNIYDDIYLQYQVEGVYYNEVCKHEGRQSKQFPLQDLVTPRDCVAFLGLLVETGLLRPHLYASGRSASPSRKEENYIRTTRGVVSTATNKQLGWVGRLKNTIPKPSYLCRRQIQSWSHHMPTYHFE